MSRPWNPTLEIRASVYFQKTNLVSFFFEVLSYYNCLHLGSFVLLLIAGCQENCHTVASHADSACVVSCGYALKISTCALIFPNPYNFYAVSCGHALI